MSISPEVSPLSGVKLILRATKTQVLSDEDRKQSISEIEEVEYELAATLRVCRALQELPTRSMENAPSELQEAMAMWEGRHANNA